MLGNQDVKYSLICAVRDGRLNRVRELINSVGLSDSHSWSEGYVLLCDALEYNHAAVAKLLLISGSKVNSKNSRPCNTPLHFAVINGDIEIVQIILDKGANINAKNKCGKTPLHIAIENKNLAVTELLLKHNPDVNARDNDGTSLLHVAAEKGCLQIFDHILKHWTCVNCVCTSGRKIGYTPLHFAVGNGNKEVVRLLLSRGANVDVKGKDNITPLHIAAVKGYVHIAEDLLNHGACIHSVTLKEGYIGYMPLHLASKLGNEESVKLFLNRGADVNNSTKRNVTPLHIATERGHETVVKLLLQHGAKVDSQNMDGKTILHLAVEKGYLTIVKDVLKYCPDINNQSNRSSLKIAVLGYGEDYKKIVEALLNYGFIFIAVDANNPNLLHAAAEKGYLTIVEDLLKCGANVNMLIHNSIFKDFTLLHSAAKHKQEEVAKLLISYKADINAQDETGKTPIFYASVNFGVKRDITPLHLSVQRGNADIITMLLNKGADVNAKDNDGITALHMATYKGHKEDVQVLLECGANVDSKSKSDVTPLHLSAQRGNEEIITMLLKKGANVNAKRTDGLTPLHIATKDAHKEVVKVLLECGAKVDSKSKSDITPLHLGAQKGYQEIVETILKFGADIDSRDEHGRTALHIASKEGHKEVVVTLLEHGCDINIISQNDCTALDHARAGIESFFSKPNNYDSNDDFYDKLYYGNLDRGVCPCDIIAEALQCHMIKMTIANLYVSERNLLSLSVCHATSSFFELECEEEIAGMKSEKINNLNISFYDILAKDTSSLAVYMRNENIVQVLKSDNYRMKFPIYASMIKCNFRKYMERKELLEQGNEMFHFLFNNFPELPYECTEKIFSYLSDKDLRMLINASKPL